jgi:protein-L-isoaspartate(D-aspartate) O-methyltransferase
MSRKDEVLMMATDAGHGVARQRANMVERLRRSGVRDPRVLVAMATVPRERFLPAEHAADAYQDRALPLGAGQTISAPQVVAMMAAALRLEAQDRVLEVGGGAGYAAAVLSRCARQVITVERHQELVDRARDVLGDLGYHNVEVRHGDGTVDAADQAPFDAISVAAMANELPAGLVAQLTVHGHLVCPVGNDRIGQLICVHNGHRDVLGPVAFVPLITGSDR